MLKPLVASDRSLRGVSAATATATPAAAVAFGAALGAAQGLPKGAVPQKATGKAAVPANPAAETLPAAAAKAASGTAEAPVGPSKAHGADTVRESTDPVAPAGTKPPASDPAPVPVVAAAVPPDALAVPVALSIGVPAVAPANADGKAKDAVVVVARGDTAGRATPAADPSAPGEAMLPGTVKANAAPPLGQATAAPSRQAAAVPADVGNVPLPPVLTPQPTPVPTGMALHALAETGALRVTPQMTAPADPKAAPLAEMLRRAGMADSQGVILAKGPGKTAPGLPVGTAGLPVSGGTPDADVGIAVSVANVAGVGPLAYPLPGLPGDVVSLAARPPGQAQGAGPEAPAVATTAADPASAALPQGDGLAAPAIGLAPFGPAAPGHAAGLPLAAQIAPAIVSIAQGKDASGRISISVTPDQLGQVHITVERATDGTTSIHVAAEQLATLNLLRQDQGSLSTALDQAGVGQGSHSLSFSWDGGGSGGMAGWGSQRDQGGGGQSANVANPYAEEASAATAAIAVARGGLDLTA